MTLLMVQPGEEVLARKTSLNLTDGELPIMQVLWEKSRATIGVVATELLAFLPLA